MENGRRKLPVEPKTSRASRAIRTVTACRTKKKRQQPRFIRLPRKQANCSAFP